MRNPHSMDQSVPYVMLDPEDYIRTDSIDHGFDVEVREIIAVPRPGNTIEYRGYGMRLLNNGQPSKSTTAKFVWLAPSKIPHHVREELLNAAAAR